MEPDKKSSIHTVDTVERLPFGRNVKQPIVLCSRNYERPMYPLTVQLCYFCQKSTAERDCFVTDSGKFYFSVQMCPRCMEFNKAIQDAGSIVLKRHSAEREVMLGEPEKNPKFYL